MAAEPGAGAARRQRRRRSRLHGIAHVHAGSMDAPMSIEEEFDGSVRHVAGVGPTVALAIVAVLAVGAVARPTASRPGPAKPYEGMTLNLSTYSAVPEFDFYETLMDDFKAKTGINVNYIQQPDRGAGPEDPAPADRQGPLAGRVLHRLREHRRVRRHLRRRAPR